MAIEDKNSPLKIYLVAFVIFVMACAIIVKLTNIQWVEGDYYRKLAKERTVKNFVIPANKGNLYSADGSLLATSIPNYKIRFDSLAIVCSFTCQLLVLQSYYNIFFIQKSKVVFVSVNYFKTFVTGRQFVKNCGYIVT